MIRISLFKKRSLLVILLVGSTANPLFALPAKNNFVIKRDIKKINISQEIQNLLVDKGLEKDIALHKTDKLFKNSNNIENKLSRIYNSSNLGISKEKLDETLSRYALHEDSLDLNSYSGVLGLVQNVSLKKLDTIELNEIKKIALSA